MRKMMKFLMEALSWAVFGILLMGGIRFPGGALKVTYPKDLLIIFAVVAIFARLAFRVKKSDLSLFRVFDSGFHSLMKCMRSKSIRNLPVSAYFVTFVVLWFSGAFVLFPLIRHWSYSTLYWDMAVLENVIFNGAMSGKFFTHLLTLPNHDPILFFPNNRLNLWLFPLSGIYRLFPYTETLLVLQSLALLFGVIPFHLLARKIFPRYPHLWVFGVSYFGIEYFHRLNIWDFHEAAFIQFLGLWALYFIHEKRIGLSLLFMFLSALWREDAWLGFSAYALLLGVRTRKWFLCGPLFFLGLAVLPWFAANLNLVNQLSGRYSYLGNSIGGIGANLLANPWLLLTPLKRRENVEFILQGLVRSGSGAVIFAGFPFWLISIPISLVVLSDHSGMTSWSSHYVGISIPLILYATLLGWKAVQDFSVRHWEKFPIPIFPILVLLSFTQLSFLEPAWIRKARPLNSETDRCLRDLVATISPKERVISEDPFLAQLARRTHLASLQFEPRYSEFDTLLLEARSARDLLQKMTATSGSPSEWKIREEKCGYILASREKRE
jgi:uncharacterized membrane protein